MKQGFIARDYDFMDKLQEEVKVGEKRFYLFGKPLNVAMWYDCFFSYNYNGDDMKIIAQKTDALNLFS